MDFLVSFECSIMCISKAFISIRFLHHAIMNEMEDYACKIIMVVEDGATLEMKNNFGMVSCNIAFFPCL